jgi:hypothetical protein
LVLGVKWSHISLYWNNVFQKTRRPISIKIDANYPCIKGIQVCLEKGTGTHQRGDKSKNANTCIGWLGHLKILFSRTDDPEKLNFLTEFKIKFIKILEGRKGATILETILSVFQW